MIEHLNMINTLHDQIEALLDLMQCADRDCTDIKSINIASEMCLTMFDELMDEVEKIEMEWREEHDSKRNS